MLRVFFLLFFSVTFLFANIILERNIQKFTDFEIEVYYDKSADETITDIPYKSFHSIKSQHTFGYQEGNIWFRLNIKNQTNHSDFVLVSMDPYFEDLTLYRPSKHTWIEEKNGLQLRLEEKKLMHHRAVFFLKIPRNSSQTLYIRSHSKLSSANEFQIQRADYFTSLYGASHDMIYMLLFGALIIIVLLNLFIYSRLKELMYLFYACYIFFYALWITAYSGLILYTPIDGYFHEFIIVIPFFVMFLILFSTQFLNVKYYLPKLYKPLNLLAAGYIFLSVMILLDFNPWYQLTIFTSIGVFFILFLTALYLMSCVNDPNIKLYLYAMSIYLISILFLAAMVNGWIENNDITRYSFLYGSMFEILFFTIVLTNRFYIFQEEKLKIQAELLDVKTKNEALLEEKIEHRTQEVMHLLEDKELLLKELYHRVKNNFQNIVAVLWLESHQSKEPHIKETFSKMISRIKSMSLIHEFLYENKKTTSIDSSEYVSRMIKEIKKIYTEKDVFIQMNVDSFTLDNETSNNLAIILNEVLNNSIKHHPLEQDCVIDITLFKIKNKITLVIQDNGIGFENHRYSSGLGLNLIKQFSQKLYKSNYRFEKNNGTRFSLTFLLQK